MPFEARKFIFTVSLCAMLAVNPVLADKVENLADLGTSHDVYVESTIDGMAESGIAGVQYVNRMVGVAGAAAQKAEDHAASAGGSAYKAATSAANAQTAADDAADDAAAAAASAQAANDALVNKLDKSQGTDKKNLAMVTDEAGTVYPGYISSVMIVDGAVTLDKIKGYHRVGDSYSGVLTPAPDGAVELDTVRTEDIYDGAVTSDKIASSYINASGNSEFASSGHSLLAGASGGVVWGQVGTVGIADGAVTTDKISSSYINASGNSEFASSGHSLLVGARGGVVWGQVGSAGIADAAVTKDKIAFTGAGCYSGGSAYGSKEFCGALGLNAAGQLEAMTIEKLIDFERLDGFDKYKGTHFLIAEKEDVGHSGHILRAATMDDFMQGLPKSSNCGPGKSNACVLTMGTNGSVSWQPK